MNEAACVELLQTLVDRKIRAGAWEEEFLGLDHGQLQSEEFRLLSSLGLIQYFRTSTNGDIPDDAVRLLTAKLPAAEELIRHYLSTLKSVPKPRLGISAGEAVEAVEPVELVVQ